MKIVGVIPARYQSSRFPGKPLADICGKPMIWWVYQQCLKVDDFDSIYVATENEEIFRVCKSFDMKVIMTSDTHKTGTDRIGEVARNISADLIVNIQGDEPLLEPETIKAAIIPFYTNPELQMRWLIVRYLRLLQIKMELEFILQGWRHHIRKENWITRIINKFVYTDLNQKLFNFIVIMA